MIAPVDPQTVQRLQRYVEDELRSAATYRTLAENAEGKPRRVLLQLAEGEERHAAQWAAVLGRLGADASTAPHTPSVRARFLAWVLRQRGFVAVVPLLERHEGSEIDRYTDEPHAPAGIVDDERDHARQLAALAPAWRTRAAGTLRASVFGVSDGIVSNLALVMGVLGAAGTPRAVVIAGVAGLLAGALSMAVGEYVSVTSQREVLVAGLVRDESSAAIGSPIAAGLASLVTFAIGALIPLVPFLFATGAAAALTSVAITAAALYALGAAISLLTLRQAWRSGGRQLLLGVGAAGATYLIGRLLGVVIT